MNGKTITIPDDVEPTLLAEIEARVAGDKDITETFTTLVANANGRIDNVLVTTGALDARITMLESGEGENWQGPLQQEATRRQQGDQNLKNQLDQESAQRKLVDDDYLNYKTIALPAITQFAMIHKYDRVFRPRLISGSPFQIGHYPAGLGSSKLIGDHRGVFVQKNGNTVTIMGALSPNVKIPAGTNDVALFELPQDCVPYTDIAVLCQGSGGSQWMLHINKFALGNEQAGYAHIGRYRNGASNIECGVGAWLTFCISYEAIPMDKNGLFSGEYTYPVSPTWGDSPNYKDGTPTSMKITDTNNNILN